MVVLCILYVLSLTMTTRVYRDGSAKPSSFPRADWIWHVIFPQLFPEDLKSGVDVRSDFFLYIKD
jgi:hypothetical protein